MNISSRIKRLIYLLVVLSLVSFGLNFVWENAHAQLYAGYSGFWEFFSTCTIATVGDVGFTLGAYGLVALIKQDSLWLKRTSLSDYLALGLIGFFLALGIEWRALLQGRWAYSAAMPLVPYFQTGLTPTIQLAILIPFSHWASKKLYLDI